jgi:nucleoside 2-deoxyribosyltransferase
MRRYSLGGKTMRLYFAAPLFFQPERHFNERLTQRLEAQGLTVYLPQRDGAEKDAPAYNAMTPEERGRAIFHLDKEHIFACDIFLVLLDGRIPDEGVCVELGLAYCQRELQSKKKALIGLQTNNRAAFSGSHLNPMIRVPLDYLAFDEETLLHILHQYQITGRVALQEKS